MTSRRGIFFNSKSRQNDKISTEISTPNSTSINTTNNNNNMTNTTPTTVKKKIVLNHTKRPLMKPNYSGPRKIFSTNYKVFTNKKRIDFLYSYSYEYLG